MRILLLYNPIAGHGRGAKLAERLGASLGARGHDVATEVTRPEPPEGWLIPALAQVDLIVVVGGDGAVRLATLPAMETATPLYHFPTGTENLFAREFGSDRSAERLLAAIDRFTVTEVDVAAAGGRPFLLMASTGLDAEVVHDLAQRRQGRISHLSYVVPIVRQILRWRPARLSIRLDGEPLVEGEHGFAVVGNCRQYARRLNPAANASITDGRLDVVFFPARSRLAILRWVVSCALRRHVGHPRVVYRRGRRVEWRSEPARVYQVDGDRPEPPDDLPAERVRISLLAKRLPVLLP